MSSADQRVRSYHEETKHQLHAYARSLGYMDWDTQPDPFRRYAGAPRFDLELVEAAAEPGFDDVLARAVEPAPLNHHFVSQLLFDSLALSAWKEYGEARWSLRVNPSSGNLHPTEGYVVVGGGVGLAGGPAVYHYGSHDHVLEMRRELSEAQWNALAGTLPSPIVLVGLTSIYWRESWKYGERAFRYCQHDAGHAIAAVTYAAAVLGWEVRGLESTVDDQLAVLLGVDEQDGIEAEHADILLALWPRGVAPPPGALRDYALPADVIDELRTVPPLGDRNTLSTDHHEWPIIDDVSDASERTSPPASSFWADATKRAPLSVPPVVLPARQIIRQWRSAVAMDGETTIGRDAFVRMLGNTLPGVMPLDALPWRPRIHLALFVHRVEGVDPGIYCLVRDATRRDAVAAAMRSDLLWVDVDGVPEDLGLYLLAPLDCRATARSVSCQQDIAADGAFALGMLAEYEESLAAEGPWFYRRLHWETGAIGQVLYLEAEAAGVRATGIGCFFDDAMHQVLGISDRRLQTLYHFTVGGAVDDPRLRTAPPYAHLSR